MDPYLQIESHQALQSDSSSRSESQDFSRNEGAQIGGRIQNDPEQQLPHQNLPQRPEAANNRQLEDNIYIPPNQYNNNRERQNVLSESRAHLVEEIARIEFGIERGWYKCYIIWLYCMLPFVVLLLAREIVVYFEDLLDFGFYSWDVIAIIAFVVSCVWHFRHCWLELQAIFHKSLPKAKKALLSIVSFTIFYFINMVLVYVFYTPGFRIIFQIYDTSWGFVAFIGGISLLILITAAGAKKVRDALEKRDVFQAELDSNLNAE